jgi:D-beta-D-heptose 7-phosphate kinase/D-beta-D-heptose 1-phosphate adenosyltransferase
MINVIGDIIIDEYWYGDTNRISPEAPVPIVNLNRKNISLGGAGNVYMNIKSLTDKIALHGYYDRLHEYIFDEIQATGNLMITNQMPHKIRIFSGSHYMSRVDAEKTIEENAVQDKFFVPNQFDVVILSDYNKGTIKDPQAIIKKSKRTIVDPKVSLDKYKGAFILKPNLKEFEDYIGRKTTPKSLMSEAQRLRHELEIDHFIVTLGPEGVLYVGDSIEHYEATAQEVFDVTGAGDTFTAALAYGIYNNLEVQDSVIIANKMAGLAVSKPGTYVINPKDFNEAMEEINEYIDNRSQRIHREELMALL